MDIELALAIIQAMSPKKDQTWRLHILLKHIDGNREIVLFDLTINQVNDIKLAILGNAELCNFNPVFNLFGY